MSRSIARTIVTGLVLIVLGGSALGQNVESARNPKTTGSVSGKITIKGKAAAGIAVGLRTSDRSSMSFNIPLRAITDQDGAYKFNVTAGTYEISPSAPAYVMSDNGQQSRKVVVGEGENVEGINFSLVRGGVITGRITDADNRPVIQISVHFIQETSTGSGQTPQINFQTTSGVTDDRGIYRAFGLSPGRYRVSVGHGNETFSPFSRTTYREVFYPDATDRNKASVIEVGEGTEATNIDITLGRAVETFTARGQIVDGEKGQPVPNVRFGLQRLVGADQRSEYTSSFLSTNLHGDFSVEGLTPGKYGIFLVAEMGSEGRADNTTFDIIDSDVSGITIRLIRGASISGTLVVESDDKRALAKLSQLQMLAYVQSTSGGYGLANSSQSPVGSDGSFRMVGLPAGTAFLNLGPARSMNDMKGFLVERVERDGIISPRIELKDGEQVTGIRVVVSYGTAILRGVITVVNGSLPPGARLYVRLSRPGGLPTNLQPTVDERGHFVLDGVPAGSYEVSASFIGVRPGRTVKQQVVVQNDMVTQVAMTLDLGESLKP
jgi:protocatechuate 3,4-dioxygenase beta subunit